MGLNDVVSAERLHIAFFGMRNAGKSSVVNAVTGQNLAVVSNVKGTTTDPVKKSMELLPLGPVVIIDTPGLDDEGELGLLRVKKARDILNETDIAVLVVDVTAGLSSFDKELIKEFTNRKIDFVIVYNKIDLSDVNNEDKNSSIYVSAVTGEGINTLKNRLGEFANHKKNARFIVRDLIKSGDVLVLVIPIDESAPKGRLILPQQMVIRDILDANAIAVTCRESELKQALEHLKHKPRMVITDSQAFKRVSDDTPDNIELTSFSILMARYKGDLEALVNGAKALQNLKDGDKVLIAEGCTHHRQCNDIGTVKMPNWIEKFCGANLDFAFTSGNEFPDDLLDYKLIVHCGGCMLNETAMKNRIQSAVNAGVPIVNYGIAIAHMNGILKRSLKPFDGIHNLL